MGEKNGDGSRRWKLERSQVVWGCGGGIRRVRLVRTVGVRGFWRWGRTHVLEAKLRAMKKLAWAVGERGIEF